MTETRSSIRNLEIQIDQLNKMIPEIPSNTLPCNTEVNSREECKALTMEVVTEPKEEPAIEELKEIKAHTETGNVTLHVPLQKEKPEEYPSSNEQDEPKEEQIAQFLEILRKLKAKSSHAEELEKDPPSMACLKASKGDETIVLTKECSALVKKKLSQKLPDPRSFLIPCTIWTIAFDKALCDLGSSINLMPLSVMKRLGIQEVQPAKISFEITNKSLKWAYAGIGIVRDTLIEMDKPITKKRMEHMREPVHEPQQEPVQPPPPKIPEMPQGELSSSVDQLTVEHKEHATILHEMREDQRILMEEQLRQG
ncbi:uncharacterized protein LOC107611073 [Arachis ipaensis]|uniref:uncharacterized protein LOC107611073 n=1 Tax=Arachis ipaensis TaxID=130454 RepID=UPI0007AEF411|nr:uncharacterized protein LOC107611073 [Arachis ipaensis]XP_025670241.1 uncharacterized protein LOC112770021 [Arachis hypogaea]